MFGGVWLGTSEKKESKNQMGWGKTLSFLCYFWILSASGGRAQASSAKIFRRLWEEECTDLRKTEQFYIKKKSDIISKVTHFVNSFTLLF